MKSSTFLILLSCTVLISCLREDKIDLAKPGTFTRFYSDGYNNFAVTVEQTKDGGYLMLGNSEYKNSDTDRPKHNIVVVKTDAFGSELWRRYYPNNFSDPSIESGYIASSIQFTPDSSGYVIVGRKKEVNTVTGQDSSNLVILRINDSDGVETSSKVFGDADFAGLNLNGKAATFSNSTNLYVLATDINDKDVVLMELDANLGKLWSREYEQGEITLANKLFYKDGWIYFGGHGLLPAAVSANQFITRAIPNSPSTENGLLRISSSASSVTDEFTADFSLRGNNFAFTGYKDENGGDMIYYEINPTSTGVLIINESQFETDIFNIDPVPANTNTQFETGSSISAARDGGVIILGTITSYAGGLLGRGDTDLILMKVDGFGQKQWSTTYGSKDADNGNCIRQTRDGGYIVLGTTRLGNLRTMMLIKTDPNGLVN